MLLEVNKAENGIRGLGLVDEAGTLLSHFGAASDPRVRAMLTDPDWLREATEQRIAAISLTDNRYTAVIIPFEGGKLALLFAEPSDAVLKFLLGVDFAFDIINHILTDPYDAMAVVDAKERLVFVSPIHEKFFGLRPGEGVGQHVCDVIENTRLHHVVRTGVAEVGQLQKMKGRERVVSRHPIRHDGKVVGAIGRVMFKGPQQVEALARRVNALEQEIATYKSGAKENSRGEAFLDAIVGQSAAIHAVREQIRKIAPLDIPVLIQGESGTGKELVAQALHMMSPRRDARLVTVNAAALPAQLVESELFGYEPSSVTGADKKGRAGKFEQADKGTIFLDEIGDMPLEVQSKLLRVLQDRVVERVGSDKPKKIDFRPCSATNRNLEELVNQGKFRLDLFYRISPVVIHMPSLADRLEDIPLLLNHFLRDLAKQYGREVPEVDSNLYDYLMERPWPGNIRELRHIVERSLVFCEDGRLRIANFENAMSLGAAPPRPGASHPEVGILHGTLRKTLEQVERDLMAEAMIRFNGNKKKVAEHLGVSRSYLYKMLGK
jgi:transcriptional regulator with PAS, ATPase and Fis domain